MSIYTRILAATLPSRPEFMSPEGAARAASVIYGAKLAIDERHPEYDHLSMLAEFVAGMFEGSLDNKMQEYDA
jgi:hypothetical protein